MIIIGHRGASGNYPENTLSAFQHAAALGCPWVELDVHQLEGELLVIHDEQLDRTTNGSGSLAAAGLAAVRRLDAGNDGGSGLPEHRAQGWRHRYGQHLWHRLERISSPANIGAGGRVLV